MAVLFLCHSAFYVFRIFLSLESLFRLRSIEMTGKAVFGLAFVRLKAVFIFILDRTKSARRCSRSNWWPRIMERRVVLRVAIQECWLCKRFERLLANLVGWLAPKRGRGFRAVQ